MSYNSVESVFNEAVIEDIEEEALEASQYGDIIDGLAGLSDIDISLRTVNSGVPDEIVNALIGDDEVMRMVDQEISQDDIEQEEDEED